MKIAVIGSTGQLGTDLVKTLSTKHEVIGFTHSDIEVADYDSLGILKERIQLEHEQWMSMVLKVTGEHLK